METDNVVSVGAVSESADGHVVEVVVTRNEDPNAPAIAEESPSAEEVVEAVLDAVAGRDDDATNVEVYDYVLVDPETGAEEHVEVIEYDVADASTDGVDETDLASHVDTAPGEAVPETPEAPAEFESAGEVAAIDASATNDPAEAVAETTESAAHNSEEADAAAATEAHAAAATEAQEHADAAVAAGNYEAASEFRETAENEGWEAGDSSMLHGSTSTELDSGANYQAQAEGYEQLEAQHAAAGDYEAAREDASHASSATGWADYEAGGADHSGQANAEYAKEDWAVWEQHSASDAEQNADYYAAQGEFDTAGEFADSAAAHQEQADAYGHEGEHGAPDAVHDAASETDHSAIGASYHDSGVDAASSYEVDHSHDADGGVSAE